MTLAMPVRNTRIEPGQHRYGRVHTLGGWAAQESARTQLDAQHDAAALLYRIGAAAGGFHGEVAQ